MKIITVWVRELSRQAFGCSATWEKNGEIITDPVTTILYPPEALWATTERRHELMAIGARKFLQEEAAKAPAPSFRYSPETEAVNLWDGTVTISDPYDADANLVVEPPAHPHSQ